MSIFLNWVLFILLLITGIKVSPHLLFIVLRIVPLKNSKVSKIKEDYLKVYNKQVKFFSSPLMGHEFAMFTASSDTVYFILSTDLIASLDDVDFKHILNLYESGKYPNKAKAKILQDLWILFYSIPYSVMSVFSLLTANRLLIIEKFFLAPLYLLAQKHFALISFLVGKKAREVGSFKKVSMVSELDTSVLGPHLFLFYNMLYFDLIRKDQIV